MEKKTIKTKQAIEWHFAGAYLYAFRNSVAGELEKDERFSALYSALQNYVQEKIEPPCEGDIRETYVIVEVEPSAQA